MEKASVLSLVGKGLRQAMVFFFGVGGGKIRYKACGKMKSAKCGSGEAARVEASDGANGGEHTWSLHYNGGTPSELDT